MDKKPIPTEVITEMMGQTQFHKDSEKDLSICEQIADQGFTSMKEAIRTISENTPDAKMRSNFMAFTRTFESSTFFGPYMKSNP